MATQGPKKEPTSVANGPNYNFDELVHDVDNLDWDEETKNALKKYVRTTNTIKTIKDKFTPVVKFLEKLIGGDFEKQLTQKLSELEQATGKSGTVVGEFGVLFQKGFDKDAQRKNEDYEKAFRDFLKEEGKSLDEVENSMITVLSYVDVISQKRDRTVVADKIKVMNAQQMAKHIKKTLIAKLKDEIKQDSGTTQESLNKIGVISENAVVDTWNKISQWLIKKIDNTVKNMNQNQKKMQMFVDKQQYSNWTDNTRKSIASSLNIA